MARKYVLNRLYVLGLLLVFLVIGNEAAAQNISNEGTDFWAVFPTHVPSGSYFGQMAIFVTSKGNSKVTVSCGTYTETKVIPANTAIQFDVLRSEAYVDIAERNTVLPNRGIHIKVEDGLEKVSVYAEIWGRARSAASLILPYETLGQTYYSMNYTQTGGGNNHFTLVGVDDNTKINIKSGTITLASITLSAGDVYEYLQTNLTDLTGIYAEVDQSTACKRFAAFSGSSVIYIGCTTSADPLFQQLYPVSSWGKNYGVVPFIDRQYDLRILAQEDNTTVKYGNVTQTINKGQYVSTGFISEPLFIAADKLISVAQYSLTQNCSNANGGAALGDPEMVILNPIEFNIKKITVFSSTLESITNQYLNILIRTDKANSFAINGIKPNVTWQLLSPGSIYSYAQIRVTDRSLTLTADDGFNAIGYGYGSVESYAYSAGTNLSSNNYLTVVNTTSNEEGPNGCIGETIDFKINLPYEADKITWVLNNETPIVTQDTPEPKVVNGQTLYSYKYPANKTYTQIGEYTLEVTAHVPQTASNCVSGNLVTNYIFNIYDLPTADFETLSTSCTNSDVQFTDKSTTISPENSLVAWQWDFGDGTVSTDQNPKHKFLTEGDYTVKLTSKSNVGCYSTNIASQTVRIFPLPKSKFASLAKSCINTNVLFTDQSAISTSFISTSKIVSWKWNFGDGTEVIKTDNLPFSHQYNTIGNYTITLTTTSDQGCVSDVFTSNIEISELPKASFIMPDICLNSGTATFTNTSVNDDGTTNNIIKYEWNFDKDNPNTAGNLSTAKDGVHLYLAAKVYKVELKITNQNGCESTIVQNFTVNGAFPVADFEVLSQNTLCSNESVVIQNKSTIDFGNIVKLKVYKDFDNNPTDVQVFDYPNVPTNISLNYDPFNLPLTKSVKIRMEANSSSDGVGCSTFKEEIIILKSSPIINFENMPAVCQNDGNVVLTQAFETAALPGKGIYSSTSKGLDGDGTFNPKLAGVGLHNITYTFTSDNNCSSSLTKTITVNKSPIVDAGSTLYILAGGEIIIPTFAEGDNLVYSWFPATGLNKTDVLNPTASPDKTTEYTLTATSEEECAATTKVNVVVLEAFTPPNSFTPNGDGVNDLWLIKYIDTYPNASVEIFNRNGLRVYFSNGYTNPFDGNYRSQPLPVGVYYYKINPRNGRNVISGPLTIIR